MKIAIRVDAAPELGSGHLVRTLTLADALRSAGHDVSFASVRISDDLREQLVAAHHAVAAIDGSDWTAPLGQEWDKAAQQRDFQAFRAAVSDVSWAICDHYGLGAEWESAARAAGLRVMAIDDLGRAHDCELLLDQNFYADPAMRYRASSATVLMGPHYALLRPAFAAARATTGPRRGAVKRMLLFMGGIDAIDATSLALDSIEAAGLATVPLDVVIGSGQPARATIETRCSANAAWQLHVQSDDMAGLLAVADLAVGAGGTSTWERCALGVPTLAIQLAENQREVLREGARAGFLYALEAEPTCEALSLHLRALVENAGLREHLSANAWSLVDGNGTSRVIAALLAKAVAIDMRRATPEDCRDLYNWRNSPMVRTVSRDSAEISYDDHVAWLSRSLANPDRWLLVGERCGKPIGVVRFDRACNESAEVSIYLAPQAMGSGEGGLLLLAAERWLVAEEPAIRRVTAVVMDGNGRSERLFDRAGYHRLSRSYSKEIAR